MCKSGVCEIVENGIDKMEFGQMLVLIHGLRMKVENIKSIGVNPLMPFLHWQGLRLSLILFLSLWGQVIFAQPAQKGLYYVGAIQRYSSWGECGNNPTFNLADVMGGVVSIKIIGSGSLNKMVDLYNFEIPTCPKVISGIPDLENINVKVRSGHIINDDELNYIFDTATLKFGRNVKSGSASDPCDNSWNWSGNREGYYTSTEVYIDDPVNIVCPDLTKNSLELKDNQYLKIRISDYYENEKGEPKLWVSSNNGKPRCLDNIVVRPNTELWLSYSDIFGSDTSQFGKILDFWVEKRLLNNAVTSGLTVSNVKFYPRGVPFKVESVVPSACSSGIVSLFIRPDNLADTSVLDLGDYYCSVTGPFSGSGCTMERVVNEKGRYRLIFENKNASFLPGDKLEVQMQNRSKEDQFAPKVPFTLPETPPKAIATQIKGQYDIGGDKYDVPSDSLFLLLQVNDKLNRSPYDIRIDDTLVASQNSLPTPYKELSATEQTRIRENFESYFSNLVNQPDNPYRSYFEKKLQEWANSPAAKAPVKLYDGSSPVFLPDGERFLFLRSGDIYLGNINGEEEKRLISGCFASDVLVHSNGIFFYYISEGSIFKVGFSDPSSKVKILKLGFSPRTFMIASDNNIYFTSDEFDLYKIPSLSYIEETPILIFDSQHYKVDDQCSLSGEEFCEHQGYDSDLVLLSNCEPWYIYTESNYTISNDNTIDQPYRMESSTYAHNLLQNRNVLIGSYSRNRNNTSLDYNSNFYSHIFAPGGDYLLCNDGIGFSDIKKISLVKPNETTTLIEGGVVLYIFKDNKSFLYVGADGVVRKSCITCTTGETIHSDIKSYNLVVNSAENCYLYGPNFNNTIYAYYNDNKQIANYYRNKLYPNKASAEKWYNDFKDIEWERWKELYSYILIKHSVIKENTPQKLTVTDRDTCSWDTSITVNAPPSLKFDIVTTPASNPCTMNGTATITYKEGGKTPYILGTDTLRSRGDAVILSGLGKGLHQYTFSDGYKLEFVINSNNGFGIDVTDNTCQPSNGEIRFTASGVSGSGTYSLYKGKELCGTTTGAGNKGKFSGLNMGSYTLKYEGSGCSFSEDNIEVKSNVFDFDKTPMHPITVGGVGSVVVDFVNRTGPVDWTISPIGYHSTTNDNNATYGNLPNGAYTIQATHNGCTISKGFPINGPEVSADVKLNQRNGSLYVDASISSKSGFDKFILKLTKVGNDARKSSKANYLMDTLAGPSAEGNYSITLDYGLSYEHSLDLCTFAYPLDSIKNSYKITTPIKCNGGGGAIMLTPDGGIEGGIIEVSTKDPQQFSGNMAYDVNGGDFTYILRSKNTRPSCGGRVTVSESVVKQYTINIPQPEEVSATVIPFNVTCAGYGDGKVSLTDLKGGGGQYQYLVDGREWKNPSEVTGGLAPGDYNVYLKDVGNSCDKVYLTGIKIKQPDSLKVDRIEVTQPTCELENGAILVEVKGGNGNYTYEWLQDGKPYKKNETLSTDTIFDLGNKLPFGIYTLTVVDNQSCSVPINIPLREYHNPSVTDDDVKDVACYGERNGEVKVLSMSGTTPMRKCYIRGVDVAYSDTIRDLSSSFDTLAMGKYEIFVLDTLGCSSSLPYPVIVNQPDAPINLVLDSVQPVIVKQTASGSIKSTSFGGNDGLKEIKLFNSQATCIDSSSQLSEFSFTLDSLRASKYAIQVKDVKGCSFKTDSIWVQEPDTALRFTVTNKQNARCKSQVGSVTVQGSGGWGGYSYKREDNKAFSKRNTFDNLYAGDYIITVKDRLGATFIDTVLVEEPKDSLCSWVSEALPPTCSNNGELKVGIKGGRAPYTLFSDATKSSLAVPLAQTVSLKGLAADSYSMHVIDSSGCRFNLEALLLDTAMIRVAFNVADYPSGANPSGGAIQAFVTGGAKPYTYEWRQQFGEDLLGASSLLKGMPSGHYSLRVTGTDECSKDTSIYLPGVSDAPFTIAKLGNETSLSAQNGFCRLTSKFKSWKSFYLITPKSKKLPFNPGDSTALFYCKGDTVFLQNLAGGSYFISGITAGDTTVYTHFTIEPYRLFQFRSINVVNVDTIGGTTGEVVVVVTGGGGGNKFEWSRVSGSGSGVPASQDYPESSTLSGLTSGKYRVAVTDRYGNTLADTVRVEEPGAPLSISIAESKHESCKTYKDAYVVLQAEGGWGDYQFRHDSAVHYTNGKFFDKLDVRQHYFYLTDKMGVVDSIAIAIAEPDYLTSSAALVDSVNCKHAGDGRVEFEVKGGTAPYRLANIITPDDWTPGTVATGIAAGEYRYVFTDANSCVGQDTVEVNMYEPDSLLFNKIDITHTTCNTDNGAIKVLMQGGTKPYTYAWRNFSNDLIGSDSSVNELIRNGLYTLDVYDYHNCHQHIERRINPSTNPAVTNVDTTAVLCYGGNTGKAFVVDVKPGEPFAPYNFTWSNGDTGKVASGYRKGVHFVTISDTNKCSTVKYFEVTQPDSLRIAIADRKNAHCFGYNDAFLLAEGRGGVGGYAYRWSTGDTTALAKNLYKGDYGLKLTDANKCLTEESFTIDEPAKQLVDLGDDIKMCPGNSRILDGQDFATHKWFTKQGVVSNERYYTAKEANDYYLEVTNSIGCFAWDTLNLSIGNDALKADFLLSSQAKLGDTLSLFELSNIPLDSLQWDYDNSAFSKIGPANPDYVLFLKTLKQGIYNINLYAFSGGCVSVATKQVEIIADTDTLPNDGDLGYKDPLIKSFTISPNPSDGNFYATVELREVSDINLVMFSIVSSAKIDERSEHSLKDYSVGYNLSNLNSGVYLLILKAGSERKQVKIIIQ